ncbi:hypothetical protein OE88DRAFT_1647541 [Heliocybe sulcata]|uniref:Uncharacterized protein n=1 Tax=Heliocybe sulcata TaxID=5364 RepID=A0A5C3MR35_9AGAM|nr:hypothetical protein OE88DRAFT_1647541 [Heliocybe sulcata]
MLRLSLIAFLAIGTPGDSFVLKADEIGSDYCNWMDDMAEAASTWQGRAVAGVQTLGCLASPPEHQGFGATLCGFHCMLVPFNVFPQLQKLSNAVDAVADLSYWAKATPRVWGAVKEEPPPVARKLENCAQRWMVMLEWLSREGNKIYNIPDGIAKSGRAWVIQKTRGA